jgi:hypothetical protein
MIQLSPQFVSGFAAAGEACFTFSVVRNKKMKVDLTIKSLFIITQHQNDKALLEQIKTYFCAGSISKQGAQTIQYSVQSVKDLAGIIDHFDKYPLITKKRADYELFKQVFYLISRKEHLTISGVPPP